MSTLPAIHTLTFLQNATWEFYARFCTGALVTTYDPATDLFQTLQPHGRTADQPVVLVLSAPSPGTFLPPGFQANWPYFVLADGLTDTAFKLGATVGGAPLAPRAGGQGEMLSTVALDLTDVVVDCDVVGTLSGVQLTTFTPSLVTDQPGLVRFRVEASATGVIEAGRHKYDTSLTTADGTRLYYLSGILDVQPTVSRN